jgi:hypothetical protein
MGLSAVENPVEDQTMNAVWKCVVVLSVLAISGCDNSPKLDATSMQSLEASRKAMTDKMSPQEKREFATDTMTAIGTEAIGATKAGSTDMYKSLHGMSVDQIRTKAAEAREKKK